MNREHLSDSLIQEFLDKQTPLPISARSHVQECDQCRETLETYREIYVSLSAVDSPRLSSSFADRVMERVRSLRPVARQTDAAAHSWLWTGAIVVGAVAISAVAIGPAACQNLLGQLHELWSGSWSGLQSAATKYLAELSLKPTTAALTVVALGGIVLMDRLLVRVRRGRRLISLMV